MHSAKASALVQNFAIVYLIPWINSLWHHINTTAGISFCEHIKSCETCTSPPPEATSEFLPQILQILAEAPLFVTIYTVRLLFCRSSSVHNVKSPHMIVFDLQAVQWTITDGMVTFRMKTSLLRRTCWPRPVPVQKGSAEQERKLRALTCSHLLKEAKAWLAGHDMAPSVAPELACSRPFAMPRLKLGQNRA